jgi:CcmD family protein
MTYLVAAYAVLWAISFGLVFSLVLRQRKLQAELETLRLLVEDDGSFEGDR